jgi:ATP-dependent exoDNAse (exonuclease V) beta subunit
VSEKVVKHISFSSFKDWKTCPYYFKLTRIDGLSTYTQSIFTEFGIAIHQTIEFALLGKIEKDDDSMIAHFNSAFLELIDNMPDDRKPGEKDVQDFLAQGTKVLPHVLPSLAERFENYEVVQAEEDLYEDIGFESDLKFKGYIDLVIKTPDDKYHVIDWKTSSWGWDAKKKSDPMVTYQLTYYKHYFALKHKVSPEQIETYFGILKRTAKTDPVEIFRVTSGPRKTKNALKMLEECVYNVGKDNHVKNKLSCARCEFNKTQYCP